MKRAAILLLAALLLCTFGCKTGAQDDPNAVFIDPNAVRGGEYGELYFEADGVRFGIYDETETVLKALPPYRSTFAAQSCAFEGEDVVYFFTGYQITTNEIDGTSRITVITVTDDRIKTPQGLYIGMPEQDAISTFPALYRADWNLLDGSALLSVTIADGVIAGIVYTPSIAEE